MNSTYHFRLTSTVNSKNHWNTWITEEFIYMCTLTSSIPQVRFPIGSDIQQQPQLLLEDTLIKKKFIFSDSTEIHCYDNINNRTSINYTRLHGTYHF